MKNPPPLSPELEALLAPHRAVLSLAPSVEARALARAAAVYVPERGAGRVLRPLWMFAAAAGVVLVLGAAAYAARGWIVGASSPAPAQPAPSVAPDTIEPPRPAVVAAAREPEAPATIAPEAAVRRRAAGKTNAAPVQPTNAELALLRAAREDVTRGDFAGALAVIADHAHRFRHGGLVEEREALRVKSLAGLGHHEEARRTTAAFHARFPHSVFLSTFERMKEAER
jgi:hypothetical protein